MKPNILYTSDNLYIMNGMNSESVDLIYLDPPFNTKRTYAAPIGSKAAGASFKDIWTWDDVDAAYLDKLIGEDAYIANFIHSIYDIHGKAMASYLCFMAQRMIEMRRILKSTGSFYIHIDPTASHYLKILCDRIFGKNNFRNEIIWCYLGMPSKAKKWQAKHDVILFYSKSDKHIFNVLKRAPTKESLKTFESAKRRGYNVNRSKRMVTVFDWDKYHQAIEDGILPSDLNPKEFAGGQTPQEDWWADIKILGGPHNKEHTGYPTQKPLKLIQRIIKSSSNKGDIIFDPFCGCATTLVAAQQLGRKWIGIDIEEKARELVMDRLKDDAGMFSDFIHTRQIPIRTDIEIIKLDKITLKQKLFHQQNQNCNGCRNIYQMKDLEIDHIIPSSKGGQDVYENFQLLCGNCNRIKGDKPMQYLNAKIEARIKATKYISFD